MLCVNCRHHEAHPQGAHCEACAAGLRPPVAAAGAPGAWLRPPLPLARWTAGLLGLVAVTDLFALWADFGLYDLVRERAAAGDDMIDVYTTRDAHLLVAGAALTQAVAMAACAVVFLVWFHRVRVNAEVFSPHGHGLKRNWTLWGWFVPVVNLWFPRRIAGDIWRASAGPGRAEVLLSVWWAMWLGTWVLGRLAGSAYDSAFEADATQVTTAAQASWWAMSANAFDAAAAVVAAWFVLRLSGAQHRKAVGSAAAAPPPAAHPAPHPVPPRHA
ncbi:DUF4328 domain-containing protein [Streptomyces chilikensis]|uniref:DUF4328 domain-containing protein n=1 Tax=Streptomyces chilikensis TaxID=1194079 RepID=A0ABV3EX60_9ACTN